VERDKIGAAAVRPTSWANLLEAYRRGPKEKWSGLLLERLGPWLTVAKRQLRAVPPYLDADDIAQQLALEVLRIAARWRPACEDRWIPRRLVERAARQVSKALLRERVSQTEELDPELQGDERSESDALFDTPIGNATAADLRVIYRTQVLPIILGRLQVTLFLAVYSTVLAALVAVALNAGAALYAAGRAVSIADGIDQARKAIAGGKARAKLDEFVAATRRLGGL